MNRAIPAAIVLAACAGAAAASMEQLAERPPAGALGHPAIAYHTRPTTDAVAELNRRIEEGTARLAFDEGGGYLRSVLDALRVPADSQMLVM